MLIKFLQYLINTLTSGEVSCIDDTLLPSLSGSTHRDNVIGAAATEMALVRACTATILTLQGRGGGAKDGEIK